MKDPISKSLYGRSVKSTPGGVSSPVRAFQPNPLFIDGAKGCMIRDVDGNEYIDLCMSYGPVVAGHACDHIIDAVEKQLKKGTVYGAPSVPELNLIEKLCEKIPSADMVRLANSGTEATMHAIRLARGFTGKNGVVKMNGGFHGAHDTVLVAAGSGSAQGVPGSMGVPADSVKNTYTVEYNDTEMMESLLSSNGDIGCVIMEPVLGNVGTVPPRKGYLEDVRKVTEEHGVILIFDEVITGLRLSDGGAQKVFGVTPDLTTMGKNMGGGFPAGAFGGKREIMENVSPAGKVYAAGTFAGNPITATAGLAQIEYMCSENRYAKLNAMSDHLVSGLSDILEDRKVSGCVQSAGSMFSVFFGKEQISNGAEAQTVDRDKFSRMFAYMLQNGVFFPPSALETQFLSAAHGKEEVSRITEAFDGFLEADKS